MTYRALDEAAIIATGERLAARIHERFPESGLSKVAGELVDVARESSRHIADARKPHWPIRIATGVVIASMLSVVIGIALTAPAPESRIELFPLLQIVESAINDVIFLGVAVFFLVSVETRLKRNKALHALHQLRSLAHVIDMHQLTKDPEQLLSPGRGTTSSPKRTLDRFELGRYLDYCTEMLALISKVAALYVQDIDDPQVLNAVNDIQGLTTGLSANIWQKIVLVDTLTSRENIHG
jgi:hypothetical protein